MRLLLVGAALSLGASGCGVPDCTTLRQASQRDECLFSVLEVHLADGDLDAATESVASIAAPVVRAAAIRRLVAAQPPGLDANRIAELCATVPAPDDVGCRKAVARPHLWER